MLKRLAKRMHWDERGITGLETAIILIAFVVVASVFAYTVLSAGIFSSQKGKEAVYSGLEEARSTVELKGDVVAMANATSVTSVVFCVGNALDGEAIDFTIPPTNNVTVISYSSQDVRVEDLPWTKQELGKADGDNLLEMGELFEITVDVTGVGEIIGPYQTFTLEVMPPTGSVVPIERTTPAALKDVMVLH
jgi:flagellin FlaB